MSILGVESVNDSHAPSGSVIRHCCNDGEIEVAMASEFTLLVHSEMSP